MRERLSALLDEGSFHEIGALAGRATYNDTGELVSVRRGAADAAIGNKIAYSETLALELKLPMIRLVEGTGGGSVKTLEICGPNVRARESRLAGSGGSVGRGARSRGLPWSGGWPGCGACCYSAFLGDGERASASYSLPAAGGGARHRSKFLASAAPATTFAAFCNWCWIANPFSNWRTIRTSAGGGTGALERFSGGSDVSAAAAEKMIRFIDLCDTFHLPCVNFVDNPGFLIGSQAEKEGSARIGARALMALYLATVPWVSILLR